MIGLLLAVFFGVAAFVVYLLAYNLLTTTRAPRRLPSREDLALSMLRERFARDEISQLDLERGIDDVLAGRIPDGLVPGEPPQFMPSRRRTVEEQIRRARGRGGPDRANFRSYAPTWPPTPGGIRPSPKVVCDGCGCPTIPHRGLLANERDGTCHVTYCDACWTYRKFVAREAVVPEPGYEVLPPSHMVTGSCGCIVAERPLGEDPLPQDLAEHFTKSIRDET